MGLRLDISCNKLTEGDIINITTIGVAGSYDITVINENNVLASSQVLATANYKPSFDVVKVSVQRLASAIVDIPRVTSVTTNDTVITINFESGVTLATFTGTLNCIAVKLIQDDGTITIVNDPLVANITITSVLHNLTDFTTPQLANPHGVMGDTQTTEIYFQP